MNYFLADFLGTTWWTALVFCAGGATALVFKPLIAKIINR